VRYLRETPPPETRVELVTPATTDPVSFALSPDGRQLVFVASGDGASRLWLRPLDKTTAQPLAGTEGASYPFWSPDSRSVGFFADNKLKRIDLAGGSPQTLTDAYNRGGTWSPDGVILFTPTTRSPLFRIAASGGAAVAVTKVEKLLSHRFPQFLPGGRQFLFYALGTPEEVVSRR
jgi:WD40 repeat protein